MELSKDEKRMRILQIIADRKHELRLCLEGNGKGGNKENNVWKEIMDAAVSQELYDGSPTDVGTFKQRTWWVWRGDTYKKYKTFPYHKRSKFSPFMKFIIINICGKTIPDKIASNGDRTGNREKSSSSTETGSARRDPEIMDQSFDEDVIENSNATSSLQDRSESYSTSEFNADAIGVSPTTLISTSSNQENAGSGSLHARVTKLESLVTQLQEQNKKQEQKLQSQEHSLLQLQKEIQMKPQQWQLQPQQWQFPQLLPNQWPMSHTAEVGQPNSFIILDIPNKQD